MNKILISLFFIAVYTAVQAQEASETRQRHPEWVEDFSQALKIAKKTHKPLLVLFTGSDWCNPCKMLHEDFFDSEKFIALADKNLVLYKADFPRRTDIITPEKRKENTRIQKKYRIRGFPTVLMLDASGTELGRFVGYSFMRDTEPHYKLINNALKQYSK